MTDKPLTHDNPAGGGEEEEEDQKGDEVMYEVKRKITRRIMGN